ncbi:MAG: D-alanyl-D-alanine carboxypeptidase family protein [Candidatus Marinimicrobia bacterium]|nr:D-alanyl-D-alanine carboxypeptidase family protein [Candidatus Neomarinimicrobiota bacterium]MDD5581629.1 D-alanyl-D-alanine carboxypeptidase family protein [Candidatus Neomarinimicrobiota bacterium]
MIPDKKLEEILIDLGLPVDYGEKRQLPRYEECSILIKIGMNPYNQAVYLRPEVAEVWETMRKAAEKSHIILLPLSGFRSIHMQADIIRSKQKAGRTLDDIMRSNAPPGYSQHHTGCAIDIVTPDVLVPEEVFDTTPAFLWLKTHAHTFGFVMSYPKNNREGFIYEPWHWFYQLETEMSEHS